MASKQTRLDQFEPGGLPDPPLVILDINCDTVYAPTNDGKIAGHIGPVKHRRGRAFVSRRTRQEHYYRDGGGYAISKSILGYLTRHTAHHIIMHETDRSTALEFGIAQYVEDGQRVEHAPRGDPQVYVPKSDARHTWQNHDPVLDVRGGS